MSNMARPLPISSGVSPYAFPIPWALAEGMDRPVAAGDGLSDLDLGPRHPRHQERAHPARTQRQALYQRGQSRPPSQGEVQGQKRIVQSCQRESAM